LLWSKDPDYQQTNNDMLFKDLSKNNSIKYILEKMVRISTILVYGRIKDFGINCNTFLIDHEFDILNLKIKEFVEIVYTKLQVDEETMDQEELEKKMRVPRYLYDTAEIRKKLNLLAF
jgi:hypothetical protein